MSSEPPPNLRINSFNLSYIVFSPFHFNSFLRLFPRLILPWGNAYVNRQIVALCTMSSKRIENRGLKSSKFRIMYELSPFHGIKKAPLSGALNSKNNCLSEGHPLEERIECCKVVLCIGFICGDDVLDELIDSFHSFLSFLFVIKLPLMTISTMIITLNNQFVKENKKNN